jgi:4-hydroxybenzoate polyprenyltransferase
MKAYLQLFRWPNLLVISLTQILVRYTIILPALEARNINAGMPDILFLLLVMATLLITAAGYAINDYFDLRVDRINKPDKIILGKYISRRKAILLHSFFNLAGFLTGALVSVIIGKWYLSFIFLIIPSLLWLYSLRYKQRFLTGNILVSFMSAFVVVIVWVYEFSALNITQVSPAITTINIFVGIYAFFAFLTTLAREILKDIEDLKGDTKTGCRTLPIIMGIRKSKGVVISLQIIIILFLTAIQILTLRLELDFLFAYILLTVQFPVLFLINRIINAQDKQDYHYLSRFSKFTMIAGVLSMPVLFFYLQNGFVIN